MKRSPRPALLRDEPGLDVEGLVDDSVRFRDCRLHKALMSLFYAWAQEANRRVLTPGTGRRETLEQRGAHNAYIRGMNMLTELQADLRRLGSREGEE